MSFTKWFLVCCLVSLFGALASVVLEITNCFGIDAGTSWTLVWVLGCVLALTYGVYAGRGRFRVSRIAAASALLTLAVVLTLGAGFVMKALGMNVPWRAATSEIPLWLLPVWLWFDYAVILAVSLGLTRLLSFCFSRLSGRPVSQRHESSA